jgi:hypothetical protein
VLTAAHSAGPAWLVVSHPVRPQQTDARDGPCRHDLVSVPPFAPRGLIKAPPEYPATLAAAVAPKSPPVEQVKTPAAAEAPRPDATELYPAVPFLIRAKFDLCHLGPSPHAWQSVRKRDILQVVDTSKPDVWMARPLDQTEPGPIPSSAFVAAEMRRQSLQPVRMCTCDLYCNLF